MMRLLFYILLTLATIGGVSAGSFVNVDVPSALDTVYSAGVFTACENLGSINPMVLGGANLLGFRGFKFFLGNVSS